MPARKLKKRSKKYFHFQWKKRHPFSHEFHEHDLCNQTQLIGDPIEAGNSIRTYTSKTPASAVIMNSTCKIHSRHQILIKETNSSNQTDNTTGKKRVVSCIYP